jgi:uncharacterized membrane protein YphA (DoxX/SURF4 family)
MRRFFSTFAYGRVGAALLTMRLVAAVALIDRGFEGLRAASMFGIGALPLLTIVAGAFLLLGLWTPVTGTIVVAVEVWNAVSTPDNRWIPILLGTLGAALTLLGPGVWSVDARLFGWRRIDIPDRQRRPPGLSER